MSKVMIEVVAFRDEYFEFYKGSLVDFKKHIDKALATIPKEYIESAKVEMEGCNNYGHSDITFKVFYERPETEDEKISRDISESMVNNEERRRDLEHLKALQEKYKNENV